MANSLGDSGLVTAISTLGGRLPRNRDEDGPIRTLLKNQSFQAVHLLSDFPAEFNAPYSRWIGCKPKIQSVAHLKDPTNHRDVYEIASRFMESVYNANMNLCFHLSSGTPTMATIWVLLGKTRFPGIFYKTHEGKALEETIPFDINVDVVPELLRMPDASLEKLVAINAPAVRGFEDIVGKSHALKHTLQLAQRAAIRDVNVLLIGESGTGKEMFARAMHNASCRGRTNRPFYALNCAAIPENLFESELFGTREGAFSGAVNRSGAFELASGGTLFLDEVGELSSNNQAKLLRVMQPTSTDRPCDRWVRPIGAKSTKEEVKVDVRVICASNRDLRGLVSQGAFRDDLYYRLAVVPLRLPSLRERRSDIEPVAIHLMERINREFERTEPGFKSKTLSQTAVRTLHRYDWPGNIRELNSVLTQLCVFSDSTEITGPDIIPFLNPTAGSRSKTLLNRGQGEKIRLKLRLKEIENHFIDEAFRETNGNQTKAAKLLGVTQQCLSNKRRSMHAIKPIDDQVASE